MYEADESAQGGAGFVALWTIWILVRNKVLASKLLVVILMMCFVGT